MVWADPWTLRRRDAHIKPLLGYQARVLISQTLKGLMALAGLLVHTPYIHIYIYIHYTYIYTYIYTYWFCIRIMSHPIYHRATE